MNRRLKKPKKKNKKKKNVDCDCNHYWGENKNCVIPRKTLHIVSRIYVTRYAALNLIKSRRPIAARRQRENERELVRVWVLGFVFFINFHSTRACLGEMTDDLRRDNFLVKEDPAARSSARVWRCGVARFLKNSCLWKDEEKLREFLRREKCEKTVPRRRARAFSEEYTHKCIHTLYIHIHMSK